MTYPFIVSGTEFCGKTVICLGLLQKFRELGLRVGYFKPIGMGLKIVGGRRVDPDAALMREAANLEDPIELITPITLGKRYLELLSEPFERSIEKINEAYARLSKDKDLIIIEGPPRPEMLSCVQCDVPHLSRELHAKVIIVVKGSGDDTADTAALYKKFIEAGGGDILGMIFNFVPRQLIERVKGIVLPAVESCGATSLGVLPDRKELSQPTVGDIASELAAEVLTCEENLDRLVEGYLIGAMTPESALSWLRRSAGSALITGGDRTDLLLTALETDVSALILTGNIYPASSVLTRSQEKGIPTILVSQDTYSTTRQLEEIEGRITASPSSLKKIRLTRDLISEYVDWRRILDDYAEWKSRGKFSVPP